ncbi:MAG: hypothetical protein ACHQX1_02535 [Candidatus Micrarchaeales archaeon]
MRATRNYTSLNAIPEVNSATGPHMYRQPEPRHIASEKELVKARSFRAVEVTYDQDASNPRRFLYTIPGTTMIPKLPDQQKLVTVQPRMAGGIFVIEYPAGKIEPGLGVIKNARKEMVEETGFDVVGSPRELGTMSTRPDIMPSETEHAVETNATYLGKPTPEPVENVTIYKADESTVLDLIDGRLFIDAKCVVAAAKHVRFMQAFPELAGKRQEVDSEIQRHIDEIPEISLSSGPHMARELKSPLPGKLASQETLAEAEKFSVIKRVFEPGRDPQDIYISAVTRPGAIIIPELPSGDFVMRWSYHEAAQKFDYTFPFSALTEGLTIPQSALRTLGSQTGLQASRIEQIGEIVVHPGWLMGERHQIFKALCESVEAPNKQEAVSVLVRASPSTVQDMIDTSTITEIGAQSAVFFDKLYRARKERADSDVHPLLRPGYAPA